MPGTTFVSGSLMLALLLGLGRMAPAATTHVPQDHKTIQGAIDAASAGDTILVQAGRYRERLRLKEGVVLRSAGGDEKGEVGLKRAEITVIDGGGQAGKGPGVLMAESASLDGFTVTNVGAYDDVRWQKHFDTYGEEQSHEHIGHFGTPAIGVAGVDCTIKNNIVHHNGYTGIAIRGAGPRRCAPHVVANVCYRNMGGGIGSVEGSTATIEGNVCFENFYAGIGHDNASPLVVDNICYGNVRAGIGISEGARPTVRGNKCYRNRRAGIGIRTGEDTQPVVEHNECYENAMAGIGNREEARPVIRHNRCYKNKMAGIGSRDKARALIEHNECYENGMAGIGSRLEAAPIIRNNRCYKNKMAGIGSREGARPIIEDNECFANGMAGIGSRDDAAPIIRNNRCYGNAMAGIGSRLGARPVIVENECFENKLAGIGSREGAAPIICRNRSYKNQMAGIGSQLGARSVIVDNESRENQRAGIGVRRKAVAVIVGNRCIENRLVAIGLPDGATAYIHGNELLRTEGGAPPLVAVKGGSRGILTRNSIRGGGVAGILVEGNVLLAANRFQGKGPGQGSAIWVWNDSVATVADNQFDGYRNAINAGGSKVTATGNVVRTFQGPAIVVRKPSSPPHVYGNTAVSKNPQEKVVAIESSGEESGGNVLKTPDEAKRLDVEAFAPWPMLDRQASGASYHADANSGRQVMIEEGVWKLVVTYGKTPTYQLFNTEKDPQEKNDLSARLGNVAFRLRGLLEQQETARLQP